jgi:Tol biopolymer transport system component
MQLRKFAFSLIIVLMGTACSNGNGAVSSAPVTATSVPSGVLLSPQQAQSQIAPAQAGSDMTSTPYVIQITPSGLTLPGSFLLADYGLGVARLDLAKNNITPVFQPLSNAFVSSAALSPDGKHILIAYGPPPVQGQIQYGYTQLYLIPADGSGAPAPLIPGTNQGDLYTSPLWSPGGKSIYFAHYIPRQSATSPSDYRLERMSYPTGQPQVIAHEVFALALSQDGARMAYVSGDPVSLNNGLYVANADGTGAEQVFASNTFVAIDTCVFSPDGKSIIFSGAGNGFGAKSSWPDQLVANPFNANFHNIPEELWRVSVDGGQLRELTHLGDSGYRLSYSPDGLHVAFSTFNALYVMNPDGSGLTEVYSEGITGSLQWLP